MNTPLITVIVPVYKTEKYLRRCVDSIRNQTYSNLEIILVDDGSPDNSGMICDLLAELDSRIKVIHKDNGGLSSARNAGLDVMSGEYVGFVDSDDWIEQEMYEILYSRIVSENADISCCGIKTCTDESVLHYFNPSLEQSFSLDRQEALKELTYNNRITGSVVDKLYNAQIFQSLRMREGILYEDSQMQPYCLHNAERITYISKPMYCYFQSSDSILRGKYSTRHFDIINIGEERLAFYQKEYPEIVDYAKMYHVSNCLTVLLYSRGIDEWKEKRKHISEYLRIKENISFPGDINPKVKMRLRMYQICPELYFAIMRLYSYLLRRG